MEENFISNAILLVLDEIDEKRRMLRENKFVNMKAAKTMNSDDDGRRKNKPYLWYNFFEFCCLVLKLNANAVPHKLFVYHRTQWNLFQASHKNQGMISAQPRKSL